MTLSKRYAAAVDYAVAAHAGQVRKGTSVPYVSHPLAVSALVIEYGGDEDQAIAALLHDVLEDCGEHHAPEIEALFGPRVHEIVWACTDGIAPPGGSKPGWQTRKNAYLAHLAEVREEALLVTLCDKLHNANAIRQDQLVIGQTIFARFSAGLEGTRWYYTSLCRVFADRLGVKHPALARLKALVDATYDVGQVMRP